MIQKYGFIFIIVFVITIVSELIGLKKFPLGKGNIVLLPLFYAVVMATLLVVPAIKNKIALLKKHLGEEQINFAGKCLGLTMLPLAIKLGTMVGSQMEIILKAGPALLLQQIGNVGTLIVGFPIALMLGMKREALGATISICREPTIGVMSDKYSPSSPEMIGAMGVYMIGNVFGTVIFSIIGSFGVFTGLHPFALAMGSGIGSASMSTAALSSLVESVPSDMKEELLAFGMTSNLLSNLMEAYIVLFITLPVGQFLFKKFIDKGVKND